MFSALNKLYNRLFDVKQTETINCTSEQQCQEHQVVSTIDYSVYPNGVLDPDNTWFETKYSEGTQKLIQWLLDNKDEVETIHQSPCWITLKVFDKVIRVWVANYPYGITGNIHVYDYDQYIRFVNGPEFLLPKIDIHSQYCNRNTAYEFLKTFVPYLVEEDTETPLNNFVADLQSKKDAKHNIEKTV